MVGRRGEGSISLEHRGECRDARYHRGCAGLWRGVTSEVLDGKRVRVKVSAKTKTEAVEKLNAKLTEQRAGVRSSGSYRVRACVEDWLAHGLDGRSARTRTLYADGVEPILQIIGTRTLRDLTATDVRRDHPRLAVHPRPRDVKTVKSRRTLEIAPQAVEALRRRQAQQDTDREHARELWTESGLVFTTSVGTELDSHNVRRSMRKLTKAAGLGEAWTPLELRHTFVSIASEAGVPIEEIAALAGHSTTRTTEQVYRKELLPVLRTGATVMRALLAG